MEAEMTSPQIPFAVEAVPADLLAWARQTLDKTDFLEQMRQVEVSGGCSLESFVDELERLACRS